MENTDNEGVTEQAEIDKSIYNRARKRVSFKIHLTVYILVNAFFWLLWYFLFKGKEDPTFFRFTLALTLGWLIFLIAHYLMVYKLNKSLIEKEVKRLKKQNAKLKLQAEELNKIEN